MKIELLPHQRLTLVRFFLEKRDRLGAKSTEKRDKIRIF